MGKYNIREQGTHMLARFVLVGMWGGVISQFFSGGNKWTGYLQGEASENYRNNIQAY